MYPCVVLGPSSLYICFQFRGLCNKSFNWLEHCVFKKKTCVQKKNSYNNLKQIKFEADFSKTSRAFNWLTLNGCWPYFHLFFYVCAFRLCFLNSDLNLWNQLNLSVSLLLLCQASRLLPSFEPEEWFWANLLLCHLPLCVCCVFAPKII